MAIGVVAVVTGLAGASPSASPPAGLSANGRLIWQFEALLHDVFGNRQPYAASASYDTNFACAGNNCFPHAKWDPYAYTFANARGSSFRLRSRAFSAGAFGNYPVPLRVNGLYIACNAAASTFLTTVRGVAGFLLSCERPTP